MSPSLAIRNQQVYQLLHWFSADITKAHIEYKTDGAPKDHLYSMN